MKIVVIGGVAGGATAAAKVRRENEDAEIVIFERGPYLSFANCGLPYFLGGEIDDRTKLMLMDPEKFWNRYKIIAKINHEVVSISRDKKTVRVKEPGGSHFDESYDKLILSQGAMPIVPPFKGIEQGHIFSLRDIPDMDRIDSYIKNKKPKSSAIIGGGFIGLEMAEAFIKRGLKVTVIEKAPHILPLLDDDVAFELTQNLLKEGLKIRSGIGATEFTVNEVVLEDGNRVEADLVLLSVGVKPEITLAKTAGLEIGITGGVRANGRMQSSDPDIYVVGDAAETTHLITGARVRIPLAGPANRQGRIAGANAAGAHLNYPGALGTSIVRILSQTVGYTGLNSKQAKEAGISFFASVTRHDSHAPYYPGAKSLMIKILAEEGSGRILGAQVMGETGVDKRVDVLSTAIFAKMKVSDLENLDLAYAPPFGSANDPVNFSGFVASHEWRGDTQLTNPDDIQAVQKSYLIDVREKAEIDKLGTLENARHIPLYEIRKRIQEIPADKQVILFCQKGQRGYLATRILNHMGYKNVSNLKGGYLQALANGLKTGKLADEAK